MRFGVNTLIWTGSFGPEHLDLLPRIREMGFDGAEISRFVFDGFPAGDARRALESAGLDSVLCSALTGGMSLATNDGAVRDRTLQFLRQGIQTAAEMGARLFVGPFYTSVGQMTGRRRGHDEWRRVVDGLQSLAPVLEETGVTLAVEPLNRFETYFLNTADDAFALAEEVHHPQVGILLDTFHANIEEKSVPAAFRTVGHHLRHVHCCENDRGIPGSGHVDFAGVFAELRTMGYDGWVTIESFGFTIAELSAATCIWRDLASTPEAIASDGVRYLKGL